MPRSALQPSGPSLHSRLGSFASATAVPLALQLVYVVCLPFAAREGVGAQTSFAYAYIGAAALVAVTASSIGLVTSVPLTRVGIDRSTIAHHVVASSWLALVAIGAMIGVFAVAGADLVEPVLGDAYGGDVGSEIARLIVALSPWMVVTAGLTVAFPLVFVTGATRRLPWIAVAALALQLPLAWAGQSVGGLYGLVVSLTLSTALVLAGLLRSLGALLAAAGGLAAAAAIVGALALVAYAPPALVLGSIASALAGLAVFAAAIAIVRPAGLLSAWRYLRALR